MKNNFKIGEIVKSTAGRDIDKVYLVYKINQNNLYLVNGDSKKQENPKIKNYRHVVTQNVVLEKLQDKILQGKTIYDAEIYSALNKFTQNKGV